MGKEVKKPITKPAAKKPQQEKFSERELLSLMGVYDRTYERRNGAIRQK